jgi:hypothetical protein
VPADADFAVSIGVSGFAGSASALGAQIVTAAEARGARDLDVETDEGGREIMVSFVLVATDEDEATRAAHDVVEAVDSDGFDWHVSLLRPFVG